MDAFDYHSRSDSSDNSSYGSTGSAYQLILDHILTYPASFEIPLRTMYTLNCASRAQPVHARSGTPSSTNSSPMVSQGAWQGNAAAHTFHENLMAQMSQLPSQPTSLPPSFITSFVRRCFPSDLVCVDFPQALTGLDYLKDLETRRRREVAGAMRRLAIDRTTLDMDAASLSERYPGVLQWVKSIEDKERKVEALYTQVYVALRRWILINELSLLPFNKHNCVAMLNTLFPPVISAQPTSKLTSSVLKDQRDGYFRYILYVEKNGPRMLANLMSQGKAHGEDTGWPSVTRTLNMYMQLAVSIIAECANIADVQDVSPRKMSDSRAPRKVDSGVNFNAPVVQPLAANKPPAELVSPVEPARSRMPSSNRGGTTLEKLARGLKTIGRSRTDVTEMIGDPMPSALFADKPRGLRKMRSMGAIDRNGSKVALSSLKVNETSSFDVDEMRRERMKFDAGVVSAPRTAAI